jgi:uncharacterized RDD family membrane protein YckC
VTASEVEVWVGGSPPRRVAVDYAGLATRTLAFAIDAAIINGVAWFVGIVVALALSLLKIPDEVRTVLAVIGAVCAFVWFVVYFAFFWSATGQTPGNRVMQIRVEDGLTGEVISMRRAFLRVLCLLLAAIPFCAGLLLILVDRRRRALHDMLVRTEVVYFVAAD